MSEKLDWKHKRLNLALKSTRNPHFYPKISTCQQFQWKWQIHFPQISSEVWSQHPPFFPVVFWKRWSSVKDTTVPLRREGSHLLHKWDWIRNTCGISKRFRSSCEGTFKRRITKSGTKQTHPTFCQDETVTVFQTLCLSISVFLFPVACHDDVIVTDD